MCRPGRRFLTGFSTDCAAAWAGRAHGAPIGRGEHSAFSLNPGCSIRAQSSEVALTSDSSWTVTFTNNLKQKTNPGNSGRRGTTPRATAAWWRGRHLGLRWRPGRDLPDQRRQRHAERFEYRAGTAGCLIGDPRGIDLKMPLSRGGEEA